MYVCPVFVVNSLTYLLIISVKLSINSLGHVLGFLLNGETFGYLVASHKAYIHLKYIFREMTQYTNKEFYFL